MSRQCPLHDMYVINMCMYYQETMGKHNVTVLDIGQAEIHDMLSLGMLIEAPAEPGLGVLKEIVFMAHHLGLTVNFTPISSPDYERWVAEQTKPRFTVTLLTRQLHAQYLATVTKIIFDNNLNIDSITRCVCVCVCVCVFRVCVLCVL